jgi:hypothetical protein
LRRCTQEFWNWQIRKKKIDRIVFYCMVELQRTTTTQIIYGIVELQRTATAQKLYVWLEVQRATSPQK